MLEWSSDNLQFQGSVLLGPTAMRHRTKPIPESVFQTLQATDRVYLQCVHACLETFPKGGNSSGAHNLRHCFAYLNGYHNLKHMHNNDYESTLKYYIADG